MWENVIELIIFSTMKFCGSMAPHDNPSFLATEIVGCSLVPGVVDYTPACHILYILLLFNNLGNSSHQNNLLYVTLIHDDTMY